MITGGILAILGLILWFHGSFGFNFGRMISGLVIGTVGVVIFLCSMISFP